MKLWIVEPDGDRFGFARGGLRLGWAADCAREEGAGARAARGPAELERATAPGVDPLAVGLLLPAYGALKGELGVEVRELRLLRACIERRQHGPLERLVVVVERVRVRDLAPQPDPPIRAGLKLDRSREEA